jgi:protein-disulfide isomerase
MDDRKSFFEQLSPKSAMLVGLVGGIMTLCTIGFFVMLGLYVRHGFPGRTTAQVAVVPSTDTAGTGGQTAPSGPVNVGVGHFPGKGDAKAPVTIIEFADFRCPFCERFYTETEQAIMRDYW